jgi:hypothetical protein
MNRRRVSVNGRNGKRIDLSIMAVAVLGLAGCGASAASTPTTPRQLSTPTFASQSAGAIVAQTREAMMSAGSVQSDFNGIIKVPSIGKVLFGENNSSGSSSGTQTLKATAEVPGSAPLPNVSVLDVNGNLYTNGNAAFWTVTAGMSRDEGAALDRKWIQIPSGTALYTQAADDLTMSTLVNDSFDAKVFHKGATRTVDGIPAIAITYRNGGVDDGAATAYIAVSGKHLPVSVGVGGLTLHMSSWGKSVVVTPPPGAVPLASVLATVPSGATTA